MEKKQQNGSHAAGTWISGASTPQSPCPWGVSPLQHCLGLRQFPESVQPHRALSKAGSWSNGVAPLDLPEPLEVSQLRPERRTGAGWAGGNVGRARRGRVCAVRAGETGPDLPRVHVLGAARTVSLSNAFDSWGQRTPVTVSSDETALCPLRPGPGKMSPGAPWCGADPPWSLGDLRLRPFASLPC